MSIAPTRHQRGSVRSLNNDVSCSKNVERTESGYCLSSEERVLVVTFIVAGEAGLFDKSHDGAADKIVNASLLALHWRLVVTSSFPVTHHTSARSASGCAEMVCLYG